MKLFFFYLQQSEITLKFYCKFNQSKKQCKLLYDNISVWSMRLLWWTHELHVWYLGNSRNLRPASASSLFRYFVCVKIYREKRDLQRKVVEHYSSFLTADLKISVKLTQKFERQIMENICSKTESLVISINCSYSSIGKSVIWNERMKGFLCQLLSLLFGEQYFSY